MSATQQQLDAWNDRLRIIAPRIPVGTRRQDAKGRWWVRENFHTVKRSATTGKQVSIYSDWVLFGKPRGGIHLGAIDSRHRVNRLSVAKGHDTSSEPFSRAVAELLCGPLPSRGVGRVDVHHVDDSALGLGDARVANLEVVTRPQHWSRHH